MKNLFNEPILSLTTTILLFLLSFTGSIFLWVLSYPYSNPDNLQFGHLLGDDESRNDAVRNLIIASVFYGIVAIFMIYELILHLRQSRRQSWDPSIAMENVHTPKPPNSADAIRKRHTPNLSASNVKFTGAADSTVHLSAHESQSDLRTGKYRGNESETYDPK